ncbi:MAG: hypothetical protein CFH40_02193 [Alphaproteobacteria bacterium MarineAlpha10_Bin3]|nr:MAG: hypothetical protein CFH40_02193 [Alphaproteobacteria bacterium MarineAlpha10_Bin3]PPR67847.1 MAG: hypothetical protein CFH09_02193 [Alphaproteobacteria bacterium MarineAlpha4_Bin1]
MYRPLSATVDHKNVKTGIQKSRSGADARGAASNDDCVIYRNITDSNDPMLTTGRLS